MSARQTTLTPHPVSVKDQAPVNSHNLAELMAQSSTLEMSKPPSDITERWHRIVETSVPLRDIIDPEKLVNRHELRKADIEPGAIRMLFSYESQTTTIPEFHLIILGAFEYDAIKSSEELYVLLAHETTHLIQGLGGKWGIGKDFGEAIQRASKVHARHPWEQEAMFWEGMQATRFGWDREKYLNFVERLGRGIPRVEIRERQWAVRPTMARRPVRVRPYRRRR